MTEKAHLVDTPAGPLPDRRTPPPYAGPGPWPEGIDTNLLNYFVGQFAVITSKLEQVHEDMLSHKNETSEMRSDIDEIKKAFPKDEAGQDPDYSGHHGHHDKLIKTSKKWSEIGTDVTKKVFGGVTWIVLVFIALAIWNEIKSRLGIKD